MKKITFLIIAIAAIISSCEPYEAADVVLATAPNAPQFSYSFLGNDPNTVVFTDLSEGNFVRVWDFGKNEDGKSPSPLKSSEKTDTVNFVKAGTYKVTLHISAANGGGTASSSQEIVITQDGNVNCTPTIALLTGDCLPAGKCWVFSQAAAAVGVGPTPGDVGWYSSPAGGLVSEQYDDSWCFFSEGQVFQYNNNGQTIDPWNGYVAVDYTPPAMTWILNEGAGDSGEDQIELPVGGFMGVWDASNKYDIISLTETDLVVRSQQLGGTGWFELRFVAQ